MTTVTKQPTGLRQRKQAATRGAIIETAVRMFAERGVDGPTIAEIAAAADIGKGTIYNYFASKEEILVAYLVDHEAQVQRRIGRFAEADGPLDRLLDEFLRFQFKLKRPTYRFNRVFLSQLILRADELAPHIERMQTVLDPPLLSLFGRWQERGLVHPGHDLARVVLLFKEVHFGVSCLWAMEGPPFRDSLRTAAVQMGLLAAWLERGPS